jgi:ribose 5-phosphate isomerase RpiB
VIGVESIGIGLGASIVVDYLASAFDNEERNMLRLGKIKDFESGLV